MNEKQKTRLGREALLEILSIVQNGLMNQIDISESLRQLEFENDSGVLKLVKGE